MKQDIQKVYVPLKSVLDVQSEYIRLHTQMKRTQQEVSYAAAVDTRNFVHGMEKVIQELGLPITIRG